VTDETESLLIQCPLCSQRHRYKLAVDRSPILYNITSLTPSTKRTYESFKRVFTCPNKSEPFQAVIRLDTTGAIINDVRIVPDDIS
jgi:hypothetical protein